MNQLVKQLSILLCSAIVSHAGGLPDWIKDSRPSSAPVISIPTFANIDKKLKQKGTVKIIVRLTPPADLPGGFKTEGHLTNPAAIDAQRAHIARKQDNVSSRISRRNFEKRFDFIPFMALEVSPAEFQSIVSSEDIDFIQEDIPVPPTLFQSVPLIGGISGIYNGYTGSGQTVAILDTGVDKSHPFLSGKIVAEACYSTTYAAQSATPVCVSGSKSAGAGAQCSITGCEHGTHVAGIVAGSGTTNGTTFSGVAKDAKIIAAQVFTRVDDASVCGGTAPCVLSYTSDQISALNYVYSLRGTYNIASVNMSLGGGGSATNCDSTNSSEKAAIDTLRSVGIATVIASGNGSNPNIVSEPACISSAISVGATDKLDSVASYSNSAPILNLLAPGSSIYSSVPGGGFSYLSGTSMATPHVAGAWAVLKSAKPSASVSEVLSALTTTGKSVTDARNSLVKPRVQLDAAVNALKPPATNFTLSVSKLGSGGGTITSNATYGISCGPTCSSIIPVPQSNTVSLTATPNVGSVFVGWSGGACSGTSNPCIVASATGNMVVQANFLSATALISEPFSSTSVPNGWTSVDNLGGTGRNWSFGTNSITNKTGGSGSYATLDARGSYLNVDSSLTSSGYNLSLYSGVSLSFKTYLNYWNNSVGDVDISDDGGVSWTNVWRRGPGTNNTHYGAATESVDITSIAAGKTNIKVRYRYTTNNYGSYWEVDDFALYVASISSPTVTTDTAVNLTGSSATLNGSINDNNALTSGMFQYGQTIGYGSSVAVAQVSAGAGQTQVSADISGLACNATHHFRLIGSNSVGTTNGPDQTFTTTACPPGAPVISSVAAGNSRAIVYLSPPASNGGSQVSSYTVTPSTGLPVSSDTVPIVVTGLTNGSSYTFTANATNAAGTGQASSTSQAVTPGIVVIDDAYATGYQLLQLAYDNDVLAKKVMLLGGAPVGGLTISTLSSKGDVTIRGGYNNTFTDENGSPSILDLVTLSAGKTSFQNVVIKAPAP